MNNIPGSFTLMMFMNQVYLFHFYLFHQLNRRAYYILRADNLMLLMQIKTVAVHNNTPTQKPCSIFH